MNFFLSLRNFFLNLENLKLITFYYSVPLFILMTALYFLDVQFINILYTFIGHFWVLTFQSPTIEKRAFEKRYRFSTLKLLFLFNKKTQEKSSIFLKKKYSILNKGIPPLLLVFILWALFYSGHFFFVILGYGLFEGVHYFFQLIKKRLS